MDLEHAPGSSMCYPERFADFAVGCRLDALDHKGQWYPGRVSLALIVATCLARVICAPLALL